MSTPHEPPDLNKGAGQPGQYPGQPPAAGSPYGAPPPPPAGAPGYGAPGYGAPGAPGGQMAAAGYGQGPAGPFIVNNYGQEVGPVDLGGLAQMVTAGQVKAETPVRNASDQQWFPAKNVPGLFSQREWTTTLILSFLLGGFGVDRFYLGYTGLGVAKLLTCGGLGIWSLIDFIMIALRKLPDAEGRPLA